MAKSSSNIVHQYYKKEDQEGKSLLKVNPILFTAVEIVIPVNGEPETEEVELSADFEAMLKDQGYLPCNPFEFNLYLNGLV
ncbi:MAG: hypothetical protein WDO14_23995 [Bacteroidota bacterium]